MNDRGEWAKQMKTFSISLCLAALAWTLPVAAQDPPLQEQEIIRQLTIAGPGEWDEGVARSLNVPRESRSPALVDAMILALEREVAWDNDRRRGLPIEAFDGHGEPSAFLARELTALGDPRALPRLAWHAYNGGPVAIGLFRFGHQAVPHLLTVVMSPDALGDHARAALLVLSSIVKVHGAGAYEAELVQAAVLHIDGPPDHYQSAWSNDESIEALPEAIALAGVLRTPALVEKLRVLATAEATAEIEAQTNSSFTAEVAQKCAQSHLDGTRPPILCNPDHWISRANEG